MPAYKFGSSERGGESLRFITPGHSQMLKGTASPSNYDHQTAGNTSSFGRQALSRAATVPAFGFGSAPKGIFKTGDTPGPGSYD